MFTCQSWGCPHQPHPSLPPGKMKPVAWQLCIQSRPGLTPLSCMPRCFSLQDSASPLEGATEAVTLCSHHASLHGGANSSPFPAQSCQGTRSRAEPLANCLGQKRGSWQYMAPSVLDPSVFQDNPGSVSCRVCLGEPMGKVMAILPPWVPGTRRLSLHPPQQPTLPTDSQRHRVTDDEVQQRRFQMPPLEEGESGWGGV